MSKSFLKKAYKDTKQKQLHGNLRYLVLVLTVRRGLFKRSKTVFPKVCSADHKWSARLAQVVRQSLYKSIF